MTAWLDGSKGGWYRQSTNAWHNYANANGQFSADDVYFNQSLALTINHGDAITAFGCTSSYGFSGSGPPYTARIQAIRNSTNLVTNAATALAALSALTTAYIDVSIPNSSDIALGLAAIAQEVVNESHWASGNKITFVMQLLTGTGTDIITPTWTADSYSLGGGGGGGGGGTGGQTGVNASFFVMLLEDE